MSVDDKIYVIGTPLCIENLNTVSEGLVAKVNKKITINKQTCLENDGQWLENRKVCKFNWN